MKDQLASLSAKYQAALARDVADAAPPDARIISRALAPSQPVFPKTLPITLFGALAGLFFSTAFVIARELTGSRARIAPEAAPKPVSAPEAAARPDVRAKAPADVIKAESAEPPVERALQPEPKAESAAPSSIAELKKAVLGFDAPTSGADESKEEGFFSRIKQAAAEFAAPAALLPPDAPKKAEPEAPAVAQDLVSPAAKAEDPALAAKTLEAKTLLPARAAASRALVERIAASRDGGGIKVLVVSDAESTPSCAGLALARAMAREGRAILVQIDDTDAPLAEALALADGRGEFDEAEPGLAQLLRGEASFAEAIYRDGASRLHIIQSGGPVDDEAGDLDLILDALHSTYDFVLVASGETPEAARVAADADLTLIFAEDGRSRDFLYDDFAAAGARAILLAGVDSLGEIVEMAA